MIAVFVSRDAKEFGKYVSGIPQKYKEHARHKDGCIRIEDVYQIPFVADYSHAEPSDSNTQGGVDIIGDNELTDTLYVSCFPHKQYDAGDYNSIIIQGFELKDAVRDVGFKEGFVRAFLLIIKETINRSFGESGNVLSDIRMFVHWGNGSDLVKTYEEPFQKVCDKIASSLGFVKLSAYALSTRRAHLFDVSAGKIILPRNLKEFNDLENKFKDAKIDEAFVHCAAKHNWALSDGNCNDVKERLARFRDRVMVSSLENEKKKSILSSIARVLNDMEGKVNSKDIAAESANLMAKILNKEVFNG